MSDYHSRGNFLNADQLAAHAGIESPAESARDRRRRIENAAPDMLDALEVAHVYMVNHYPNAETHPETADLHHRMCERLYGAIAKAKGEDQ